MSVKNIKVFDFILIISFLVFFFCFLSISKHFLFNSQKTNQSNVSEIPGDEYESSLSRLNSIDKLVSYCDSLYSSQYPTRTYPGIVSEVIGKKFYHGYSYYNFGSNPVGFLFEPIVKNGANAIVVPDDIVKFPNAACSQQSIVGMEVFRKKGYDVRKVSMFDTVRKVGHFAYEVYYNRGWHYVDTNQEPDEQVLREYDRPSVAFLAGKPDIILEAYKSKSDPELFKRLLMSYKTGAIDKFPAPNAYLYQVTTKYLSYFGWILIFFVLLFRYRYHYRKNIQSSRLLKLKKQHSQHEPILSQS